MKKMKNNKSLKYSLFFGFYLIFFIVLFILYKNNINKVEKIEDNQEISIYEIVKDSINKYHDDNYQYKITINDNEILNGLIKEPSYKEHKYLYFFDLYNLNKLIKNSKLESKEDNKYHFILSNNELNEIFNSEKEIKNNEIILDTKDNKLIKTRYDLSNYYDEKVIIEIEYIKGDSNENSSS